MSHSKGQWSVGKAGSVVTTEPVIIQSRESGHNDVEYYGGYLIAESIFTIGDANLIAAAPEMLEALEEVLKYHNDEIHDINLWQKVELAIKKARGENK
ncbi:hypothetical protein [Sporosarcina jiandibaonis]|uniref:hypothetical protein n=1 Tax=Sporosarcina jiandibaonis TaxID=2715535 RepID=UPI001553A70A|nr:hypothetical protein [Sporosarcina jiandibaonis]